MKVLQKYFDLAFDSPRGIEKLRELILKLAMRGRLVPQDSTDESGYLLIQKINEERNKLVKNGIIRKQVSSVPIKKTNISVAIPDSWLWVTLNDYGTWQSGSTPSRNNSSFYGGIVPWVKSGEVKQGKIRETSETITSEALLKCSLNINPVGSVLIAMYGANIGEAGILEIEATTNQAVCACKAYPGIDDSFLLYLIQSLKSYFISQGAGAAQPNISREKIIQTVVPLPPYNEQKRIVIKIQELMSLCVQFERQKNSMFDLLSKINNSAIDKLIYPEDAISYEKAFSFINDKFNIIYSTKSTVEGLRKAILNLGISGKFENELGNSKHTKKYPLIPLSEEPFKLPENWIWTRLDNLGETQTGTTPPKRNPEYYGDYVPFLGPGDIKDLKITYSSAGLSKLGIEKARYIAANSILMVCIGGSIGKMAINDRDVTCNQQINTITPYEGVHLNYLSAVLQSEYFQNKVVLAAGGSATPIINKSKWISIPIPLPPLDIQIEISAIIKKLLSVCESLEDSIFRMSNKQNQILNSVLSNI